MSGNVTGTENVGGITGGDRSVIRLGMSTPLQVILFPASQRHKNVGGIIGYYRSLNKLDNIAGTLT